MDDPPLKKRPGRKPDPETRRKYEAAGIDYDDPNAKVNYCRWKKRQDARADARSDKPAPRKTYDRKITANPALGEQFRHDEKLNEWSNEIDTLVNRQKEQRRARNVKRTLAGQHLKAHERLTKEADKIRRRINVTQTALTHRRDMVRRRKRIISEALYREEANKLRKKLSMPPLKRKKKK